MRRYLAGLLGRVERKNGWQMAEEMGEMGPQGAHSSQRRAEFLLSNAVDEENYARAEEEVRKRGLDPAAIPHRRP